MSEVPDTPRLVWSRERRFASIPFEDIQPKSAGYRVKGVLPLRGLAFIVGASKAGKTFVAIDWTAKIACGAATVMGKKAKQCGVAYVGAEDPDGLELRIHAWKMKNPRRTYTPFRFINRGVNLLDPGEVAELVAELRDIAADFEAQGHTLGIIVFDTFSRCLPGAEENNSESMSRAIGSLEQIGREFDALSLVVAHHGKDGSKGIRGWSGLDAASDATVTVTRDIVNPAQRSIELSKVKNGKDGEVFGFTLQPVPCGLYDEDGDETWSMVVAYDGVAPAKAKKRKALSHGAMIVLESVNRLTFSEQHRQPPPRTFSGSIREGTWAVRREDVSLDANVHGLGTEGEKANTYTKRFGRMLEELIAAERIRVFGDAIWAL